MPDATNTAQPLLAATKPSHGPPATEPPPTWSSRRLGNSSEALSVADIKAKNELKKEMQRVSERGARPREGRDRRVQEAPGSSLAVDPDAFLKPAYGDKWYETLTKAKLGDDSNLAVSNCARSSKRFKESKRKPSKRSPAGERSGSRRSRRPSRKPA
jgi:hypothetical protein